MVRAMNGTPDMNSAQALHLGVKSVFGPEIFSNVSAEAASTVKGSLDHHSYTIWLTK